MRLREYLRRRDSLVDEIRAFVPFNLRPLDRPLPASLGNKFGLVFLPLPVGAATAAARLRQVKRHMDEIKDSPEGAIAYGMLEADGTDPGAGRVRDHRRLLGEGHRRHHERPGPARARLPGGVAGQRRRGLGADVG